MKKYKTAIILLNLLLLILYFNYSVVKKEDILKKGQLVLLKLAPVDPRSLMQGDYMDLSYEIVQNVGNENKSKRGYYVVNLDSNGLAQRVRLQKEPTPKKEGEYLIKYTLSNSGNIHIGAESYFFQEGHARKYEKAKYGGLKIDDKGNSVLTGLYDESQQLIQ